MNGDYERLQRALDYLIKVIMAVMAIARWYQARRKRPRVPDDEV
jgi:hypothetical protein